MTQLVAAQLTRYPICTFPGERACTVHPAAGSFLTVFLPFIIDILLVGWFGTERVWYLRVFGNRPARGQLWELTSRFRGRFVALGVLVWLALIPFFAMLPVLGHNPTAFFIAWLLLFVAVDMALTFVTPALAFTTKRVFLAMKMGLSMIRRHWPASAPFVLIPPFAILLFGRILPGTFGAAAGVAAIVLGTLLNLWFKGATARFYLRFHETDPDYGAAYEDADEAQQERTVRFEER